jgi:hypothetical protein
MDRNSRFEILDLKFEIGFEIMSTAYVLPALSISPPSNLKSQVSTLRPN